ncbi:MAG: hypothetical protein KDB95_13005, partial [Flavobacteriales bacterium]|nr:hypothetical protein [Flavobacteriales bacterium]
MARKRVLLTVTTYPLPSRSYEELVCTAGVLEDGSWIRIYPVPLSFLMNLRRSGQMTDRKYTWIELDLEKRKDDFRPESHSPKNHDLSAITIGDHLGTAREWNERKQHCLHKVYTSMSALIADSQDPTNVSLAAFKPTVIHGLIIEEDKRDWKPVWKEMRKQLDLFAEGAHTEPKALV